METATLLGVLAVGISGLFAGAGSWPFKLLRTYQFEHWWFIAIFLALFVVPWAVLFLGCPDPLGGLHTLFTEHGDALLKANLLSMAWGVANVLCGVCFVRIGVALTGAILSGLGVCVGTIMPLIFKGSGQFQDSPDLGSVAGRTIMTGVGIMLVGVVLATFAGLGRDRQFKKLQAESNHPPRTSGRIVVGLFMAALAGVLSAGLALSSVYSQAPVIANLSLIHPSSKVSVNVTQHPDLSGPREVDAEGNMQLGPAGTITVGGLKAAAAAKLVRERLAGAGLAGNPEVRIETSSIPAVFGLTAVGVIGGLLVNLGFAVYLLTRNKSWHVLVHSPRDFLLSVIISGNSVAAIILNVKGMLWLGALGASVGFGIQQALQMTGSQGLGFISGEWRGVRGKPRHLMYGAIGFLFLAAGVMVVGKLLAQK